MFIDEQLEAQDYGRTHVVEVRVIDPVLCRASAPNTSSMRKQSSPAPRCRSARLASERCSRSTLTATQTDAYGAGASLWVGSYDRLNETMEPGGPDDPEQRGRLPFVRAGGVGGVPEERGRRARPSGASLGGPRTERSSRATSCLRGPGLARALPSPRFSSHRVSTHTPMVLTPQLNVSSCVSSQQPTILRSAKL